MKFSERIFFRYFDFFVALFSALLTNLITIYLLVRYGEPFYVYSDEFIWVKLVSFCAGEFAFYEQRWGIIVPLLCLIYPLKFIIPLYYFPILRPILIFFDMYLLLKVLGLIFSRRVALIVFFFVYSHVFSLLKFLFGKEGIEIVAGSIASAMYIGSMRIFNPVFFMIFFLLFWYYLLRFLDGVEKWGTSNPEGWKRERLLSAIFLGLSFYSQTHWMIFTFLVFIFFVLILYFSERRARKILNELVRILLLGIIVGIPSIIFNFYQGMMIRETVERGLVVKVERDMWMLNNAFRLEYFSLFLLAILSFILHRKFDVKYFFIFSGFFVGYFLFFADYILGIYMQIGGHVIIPFKFMAKIGIGLLIERVEEIVKKFKMKILGVFTNMILIFMFFAFVSSSLFVFYYFASQLALSYNREKIKIFREVTSWIKITYPLNP